LRRNDQNVFLLEKSLLGVEARFDDDGERIVRRLRHERLDARQGALRRDGSRQLGGRESLVELFDDPADILLDGIISLAILALLNDVAVVEARRVDDQLVLFHHADANLRGVIHKRIGRLGRPDRDLERHEHIDVGAFGHAVQLLLRLAGSQPDHGRGQRAGSLFPFGIFLRTFAASARPGNAAGRHRSGGHCTGGHCTGGHCTGGIAPPGPPGMPPGGMPGIPIALRSRFCTGWRASVIRSRRTWPQSPDAIRDWTASTSCVPYSPV
jgi:hypothetical protein